MSSDTLRCPRYRTAFLELSAATSGGLGPAFGRSSVPSRSRLLLASTSCDILSLQPPRRCFGSSHQNRHDDLPRCGSGGLTHGSGLRRAPTPCDALAAVPPSPNLPRLPKKPLPTRLRTIRPIPRGGVLRLGNAFRRPRAAELGSPIRKRSGYPRPGPRTLTPGPGLRSASAPCGTSASRAASVGSRTTTGSHPRPASGRSSLRGAGSRWRRTLSGVLAPLDLRRPSVPANPEDSRLPRVAMRSAFSLFEGKAPVGGPPGGVPPSRATGGTVNLCSRSSCSPTGASWASGLF